MLKKTLTDHVLDFVEIAHREIEEGNWTPEERFTPESIIECLPPGTTLEQVYASLCELGSAGRVRFSSKDATLPIELVT